MTMTTMMKGGHRI